MRGNAREAVDVEAVRTPVGKRYGGLSRVHPADLSALVLQALASRSGRDPALVDDVVRGCVSRVDKQTSAGARTAVLCVGWPESCDAHVHDDARCCPSLALLDVNAA